MALALPIINLKKKLREPRVEMAKRIIRPLWAIAPSRPVSEIRKANARREYGDFHFGPSSGQPNSSWHYLNLSPCAGSCDPHALCQKSIPDFLLICPV